MDLRPYRLPMTAAFRLKDRTVSERCGILVRMEDEQGVVGWGDAAPLPGFSPESADDVMESVTEIRPRWIGSSVEEGTAVFPPDAWLAELPPSARCGVELAFASVAARRAGLPLRRWLNPGAPDTVAINALLAGSAEEVTAGARLAVEAGARCVKLKVGRLAADMELQMIRDVSRIVGPGVGLRLDANRKWSLAEAVAFGRRLDVPIEYMEEPTRASADLPAFAEQTRLPVALDETLTDTPMRVWSEFPGVAAVVLKPTLMGGYARAWKIGTWALRSGRRGVVSSAFESGVGIWGLAELAAALGGESTAAGLDTYRWLSGDVLERRLGIGYRMELPTGMPAVKAG